MLTPLNQSSVSNWWTIASQGFRHQDLWQKGAAVVDATTWRRVGPSATSVGGTGRYYIASVKVC